MIQIFTETKSEVQSNGRDEVIENNPRDKLLIFSLLCIQIAYPKIYSLLTREPDFISGWDEAFALDVTEKVEEKEKLLKMTLKLSQAQNMEMRIGKGHCTGFVTQTKDCVPDLGT